MIRGQFIHEWKFPNVFPLSPVANFAFIHVPGGKNTNERNNLERAYQRAPLQNSECGLERADFIVLLHSDVNFYEKHVNAFRVHTKQTFKLYKSVRQTWRTFYFEGHCVESEQCLGRRDL